MAGREGTWSVYPVEYKKGAPKAMDGDRLQLCGQAMCLEDMLACEIPEGSLFYGETRRREHVAFTPELRAAVEAMLKEMRGYVERGHTPKARPTKACAACSLNELCLPKLTKLPGAADYIRAHIEEADA